MRNRALTLASLLVAFLAFLAVAPRAAAQDGGDVDDPPSRVARLSFTRGAVSFQPAGTDDWVDATINRPMTTGDKLWSDSGSRAALNIGPASIHLSENTGFSFLNLTDNVAQIQLTAGTIRVRVKRLGDDDTFEIDTPNLAFNIVSPGIYKISVNDSGDTTIIEDRKGQGQVTGGGSEFDVYDGDLATFSGTDEISEDVNDLNGPDEFEQWSEQRDRHEDHSVSAQYVSDDAIGYDDLDDNGDWRPTPEYGNIWFPRTTVVGWAPYHYGHWAYVAPWGYTWIDDAPWGFAPFHYGRWVSVNGAWGWIPAPPRPAVVVYGGPVYVRPVYAPALVAWVGGPHFGIGVAVGGGGGFAAGVNVGWFPLGPREVFVPSYPVSRRYVTNVNVSNTTVNTTVVNNYYNTVIVNKTVNVTNVTYVNQRVPGAVVATSPAAFSSGQSVSRNFVKVDAREVATAQVVVQTPAAVPQRGAVLGGSVAVTRRPPAAFQARAVVAKTPPPPPPPSFAQRQQAIASNGGRPISLAQARQIAPVRTAGAPPAPVVRVAPPAARVAAPRNVAPDKVNRAPIQTNNRSAVPTQNLSRPANVPQPAGNNRPNQPAAVQQPTNANKPNPAANNKPADNVNRPAAPPAANNKPATPPPANNNRPPVTPNQPAQQKPADEQRKQQQLQQQQQQEQQQKAQQEKAQQEKAQQQQKADQARQQQEQQQQRQQQLEQQQQQKRQQEQQQLQKKQEQEPKPAAQKPAPPPKEEKPQPKPKDKENKDDRPPKKDQR